MGISDKKAARLCAAGESCQRYPAHGGDLTVADIMTREIVTATRDETLYAAAKTMSDKSVSCVVVLEDGKVVGILTDKDMLRGVATENTDFRRMRVRELMTSPVEVIPSLTSAMAAGKLMETKGIKRLPVVDNQILTGLVTQTDITRGLVSISPLTSVSDIMTRQVATVSVATTAAEAAKAMNASRISCVVVMHRQSIAGIVTEKDLLRRVVALHKDPSTTKVQDIMSFPVVAIEQTYSVLSAGKKLDQMRLHHLVVTAGNQLCGIVTQTDIIRAVRGELERMQQQRQVLTVELDSLVRYIMQDVARLRSLVGEMPGTPDEDPPTPSGRPEPTHES